MASWLLDRWFKPDMSLQEARILAAYVVYVVKESVPGCGKDTAIAALHPDSISLPGMDLKKLEESFGTKWAAAEQETVWKLIAEEVSP